MVLFNLFSVFFHRDGLQGLQEIVSGSTFTLPLQLLLHAPFSPFPQPSCLPKQISLTEISLGNKTGRCFPSCSSMTTWSWALCALGFCQRLTHIGSQHSGTSLYPPIISANMTKAAEFHFQSWKPNPSNWFTRNESSSILTFLKTVSRGGRPHIISVIQFFSCLWKEIQKKHIVSVITDFSDIHIKHKIYAV